MTQEEFLEKYAGKVDAIMEKKAVAPLIAAAIPWIARTAIPWVARTAVPWVARKVGLTGARAAASRLATSAASRVAASKLGTVAEAVLGNTMGVPLSWGASILRTPALLQRVPVLGRLLGTGQWTGRLAQMGKTLESRLGGYEATKRLTKGMGPVGSLLRGASKVNNVGYFGVPLGVAGYRYAMTPDDFITALNKGEQAGSAIYDWRTPESLREAADTAFKYSPFGLAMQGIEQGTQQIGNYIQHSQLVDQVGEEGADFLENQAKSEFKGVTNENAKIHSETEGKMWRSNPELMRSIGVSPR